MVVDMALLPWEALVEPCAELPVDCLPVPAAPAAAAKSYYRVLAAFARIQSDFAALLHQAAVCVFALGSSPDYAH